MREAMGGTWLFGIVALFIVLFSGFMAYSISYTKAFKTKNEILNYIEQAEGFTTAEIVDKKPVDRLTEDELKNSIAVDARAYRLIKNYGYSGVPESECANYGEGQYGGYCVKKKCLNDLDDDNSSPKVVYQVTTFISLNVPILNVTVKLPITGETKTMYYDNENNMQPSCF